MPPVKLGRRDHQVGAATQQEELPWRKRWSESANLQSAVAPPAGIEPIPSRTEELGAISLAGPHGAARHIHVSLNNRQRLPPVALTGSGGNEA